MKRNVFSDQGLVTGLCRNSSSSSTGQGATTQGRCRMTRLNPPEAAKRSNEAMQLRSLKRTLFRRSQPSTANLGQPPRHSTSRSADGKRHGSPDLRRIRRVLAGVNRLFSSDWWPLPLHYTLLPFAEMNICLRCGFPLPERFFLNKGEKESGHTRPRVGVDAGVGV